MKIKLLSLFMSVCIFAGCSVAVFAEGEKTVVNLMAGWKQINYSMAGESVVGQFTTEKDKYINITSNGLNCWQTADSMTCLLTENPIDNKKTKKTVITATICDLHGSDSAAASAGVLMRAENLSGSANVMWRILPSGDTRFTWRLSSGDVTKYTIGPKLTFPVKLRLEKVGNTVTALYKTDGGWETAGSIDIALGDSMYAGLGAFSIEPKTPVTASFRRLKLNLYTSEQGTETPEELAREKAEDEEDRADDADKIREQEERRKRLENYYMIENFADKSLTTGEQDVENYRWLQSEAEPVFESDASGTVWWHRKNVPTVAYVGSTSWTDYMMKFDFIIDPSAADKPFILYVRSRPTVATKLRSPIHYSLNLSGTSLSLGKAYGFRNAGTEYRKLSGTVPNYADGEKHTMTVEAFDNTLKISIDGEVKLMYTDDSAFPLTRGLVGFNTKDTDIKISNIVVEKLKDELGGDYDNYLGTGFNEPTLKSYSSVIKIGE